jgi:hypothetical protein
MTNEASDTQYDTEHVVLWVRWLQAKGLDAEAISGEIDRWSLGDVTLVYVGNQACTMPTDFVRAMVEHALGDERAIPRRVQAVGGGQQARVISKSLDD